MATITIETEKHLPKKRVFKDTRKLYEYLHEQFLAERLKEIEAEGGTGPMEVEEAMRYLDDLKTGNK